MLVVIALMSSVACGGKNVNTIAATSADYGTAVITGVKAAATAIADAETKGVITRNDAVKVMNTLLVITKRSEEAAGLLRQLVNAQPGPLATDLSGKVQQALDFINSELFTALVPIKDEALKVRVSALVADVSKLIATINREVLGRVK